MDTAMDTVIIDPPATVVAERQRLGLDHHDEVWDGEYRMVPPASNEHVRIELRLASALIPAADAAGLEIRVELGVFDPLVPDSRNFRVSDVVLYRPELGSARGAEGPVSLVVEIRSPGDDSFRKLPHYERFGVGEVLIVDRDTKAVRRWVLTDGVLVESSGEPAGSHQLSCVPVSLHTDQGKLIVATLDGTTRI